MLSFEQAMQQRLSALGLAGESRQHALDQCAQVGVPGVIVGQRRAGLLEGGHPRIATRLLQCVGEAGRHRMA